MDFKEAMRHNRVIVYISVPLLWLWFVFAVVFTNNDILSLVLLTIILSLLAIVFYLMMCIYDWKPENTTRWVFAFLLVIFALGSVRTPETDSMRTFIGAHVNLDYFLGLLTVMALYLAIRTISAEKKKNLASGTQELHEDKGTSEDTPHVTSGDTPQRS